MTDPRLQCQCKISELQCSERMTQEDLLCDFCRNHECNGALVWDDERGNTNVHHIHSEMPIEFTITLDYATAASDGE